MRTQEMKRLRYKAVHKVAFKEAMTRWEASRKQHKDGETNRESLCKICKSVNSKYLNDVLPKREVKVGRVNKYVSQGLVGKSPMKNGRPPKIDRVLLATMAKHINVCQVSDGELSSSEIRATMLAAVEGTEHEENFSVEYAWRRLRKEFPDEVTPVAKLQVDDIRGEWTTWEKMNQWFDDSKKVLVDNGLAYDRPCTLGNGTQCKYLFVLFRYVYFIFTLLTYYFDAYFIAARLIYRRMCGITY